MNHLFVDNYIAALRSDQPVTPILIDEDGAISLISSYIGEEIVNFQECKTGEYPGIFFYGIAEEKKHLDILTIRKCIADMSLEPFVGKNIAILRDFHTATLDAQNAILKLLEDCPPHSAIILVTKDTESIIETVYSRVICYFSLGKRTFLDDDCKEMIDDFFRGKTETFLQYLFAAKYTREQAIAIVYYALQRDPLYHHQYLNAIQSLFSTNESPRNIIDTVFLIPYGV